MYHYSKNCNKNITINPKKSICLQHVSTQLSQGSAPCRIRKRSWKSLYPEYTAALKRHQPFRLLLLTQLSSLYLESLQAAYLRSSKWQERWQRGLAKHVWNPAVNLTPPGSVVAKQHVPRSTAKVSLCRRMSNLCTGIYVALWTLATHLHRAITLLHTKRYLSDFIAY